MKQVMVVRRDLKMGKGKIAAQCCHGSIGSYKRTDSKLIKKWESDGYAKVVWKNYWTLKRKPIKTMFLIIW